MPPFPNEHACRLKPPGQFKKKSFTRLHRKSGTKNKVYSAIVGKLKKDGSTADQAFRYDKKRWGPSEARSHCKSHGGSFEAAKGTDK